MKRRDFEQDPCSCGECVQAGVADKRQLRDPQTGRWLHGYDLKRYYDEADRHFAAIRRKLTAPREAH